MLNSNQQVVKDPRIPDNGATSNAPYGKYFNFVSNIMLFNYLLQQIIIVMQT